MISSRTANCMGLKRGRGWRFLHEVCISVTSTSDAAFNRRKALDVGTQCRALLHEPFRFPRDSLRSVHACQTAVDGVAVLSVRSPDIALNDLALAILGLEDPEWRTRFLPLTTNTRV